MTCDAYVVESSSTEDVAFQERTDYWSELVNSYHCRMGYQFAYPEGFGGRSVRLRSVNYQLAGWHAAEERLHRTAQQIRYDPDEHYRFALPIGGELLVRQNGRQAAMRVGTGALFTMNAPFEIWHDSACRGLIMTIPGREIDRRLNRAAPVAAPVDLRRGLGRVVHDLIIGLIEERDTVTPCQFDAVCDRLAELLCMLVTGDDRPDSPDHLVDVAEAVRRYVREHSARPDLSGRTVADALGWSLRQVQLSLQLAGTTPRDLIREERLRLVRERLQNPAYQDWTITRHAHAAGFSSGSALSIAFRKRYGVAPREIRHEKPR
ncbi:transcriptional regulator, AraC family [Haloechinothrix alba]|uniref:Transcriptional regulator, AraC family n=1 Tax=Haloechinothrix alba TaxID=664784 RepID=A0A238Y400_9PSEU|nr:AraC family transcriptional regulator [Haloechinothrix alba]SNR65702.1 transcriptional regulator, AraC family [Haloechinothrix alba]